MVYSLLSFKKFYLKQNELAACKPDREVETEPVFVNLLRSPGVDSQPGGPERQPYFSYLSARLHRLAESISRNRFLGSINVYKYGLWKDNTGRAIDASRKKYCGKKFKRQGP
jgi:hypothetical protein